MLAMSEALTEAEMLFPQKQGQCRKSTILSFKYFYNPILINYIPSLRLKILSRLSICALYPSPRTPTKALLCCSVNTTPMATLKSWLSPIPLFGRVYPGLVLSSNAQLQPVSVHSWNIGNMKIQRTKPHTCICRLVAHPPSKLHQRQNGFVFKTRMAKTHMKELRTLKTLKW